MKFKLVDNNRVLIIDELEQTIGEIFIEEDVVQLCGFDRLESYWGCSNFADIDDIHKKDVQVFFDPNNKGFRLNPEKKRILVEKLANHDEKHVCEGCFNDAILCTCKDREERIASAFVDRL